MKIIVLGSNGQLGNSLKKHFNHTNHTVLYTDRETHDISRYSFITDLIIKESPDYVINASGYTAVDKAEKEKEKAFDINFYSVKNIANACFLSKSIFVHISTDYVFDGDSNKAYKESDITNPRSVYGESKLLGEESIIKSGCDFIIFRTSWVYSQYSQNFLKTILKLLNEKNKVHIVDDEFGNPTSAYDLALGIVSALYPVLRNRSLCGIYNLSGKSTISWYEFAKKIKFNMESLNKKINCKIIPIASINYETLAKRPKYSALDNSKFLNTFDVKFDSLDINIKRTLREIYKKS
jgi:dTDP-4-dehydrorhamnose reductase